MEFVRRTVRARADFVSDTSACSCSCSYQQSVHVLASVVCGNMIAAGVVLSMETCAATSKHVFCIQLHLVQVRGWSIASPARLGAGFGSCCMVALVMGEGRE
jgi:hypothetical protein